MNFVLLLFLLSPLQDTAKKRSAFLEAVKNMDAARVRGAAKALAGEDSRESVGALLDGYGICAKQLRYLAAEKAKAMKKMEANSDFKIDTSTNPPTIPSGQVDKYNRYQEAMKEAQGTEHRIMRVEAVARAIVDTMARLRSPRATQELLKRLKEDRLWRRRAGIAEALGRSPAGGVEAALLERLGRESEPQVRIAIMDALRARGAKGPQAISALAGQLRDKLWQVRSTAVAALKALGRENGRPAVPALIAALEKAQGRLRHEINQALAAITGVDKHGDHATWKRWYDENHQEVAEGKYRPRPGEAVRGPQPVATTFYGIPIHSRNVIFILDRSGSMMETSEWDVPKDVATGAPGANGPDIKKDGNRKIDIARWQLKLALARLPEGVRFNVIFFNHEWKILSEKMVKLSPSTRKAAYAFIDSLDPVGGTNIFDPVEKGFSFAGVGLRDKLYATGVDTIFLLTDGMPNLGQVPNAADIVVKIREMNRLKKVKINAVGVFGSGGRRGRGFRGSSEGSEGEAFLKELVKDSGGMYVSAGANKN